MLSSSLRYQAAKEKEASLSVQRGSPSGLITRISFQMMRASALSVGKRFRGKSSVCPACGARFAGSKEDYEEFDEEEDELEAWDEEEGL